MALRTDPDEYRARAEEAAQRAEQASEPSTKAAYNDLAAIWDVLAGHAQRLRDAGKRRNAYIKHRLRIKPTA